MDTIAIVDFGSQYAHLIANRVRRLGVYAEIVLPETPLKDFGKYKGIILSGGPQSVYDKNSPSIDIKIFSLAKPILGMCYGHQLISHLLGGKVEPGITKEYGLAHLSILKKTGILQGVNNNTQVWMSHGDTVKRLPRGFEALAGTPDCPIAAAANFEKKIFSAQFHMEVAHTKEGMKMLKNFVNICGAKKSWNIKAFLGRKMSEIRKTLAGRKVFLLVSGGVDSTVAYAFLAKILGQEKIYGLFVDTGFLRKDEAKKITAALKKIGVRNLHVFNAKKQFLSALSGITDPEEKRKIIGDMFLRVQAQASARLKLDPTHWVLGQGTIYPDTIESAGTKYADKIKTHHNRVPEIIALIKQRRLIEPLAELYKDEVRKLGENLGLPESIVWKHPFPGPGLAVRILCAKEKSLPQDFKSAQHLIKGFLAKYGLRGVILPIKSVGVQGDNRTYRNPLVIWGAHLSFSKLEEISTALTNRFSQINRVCLLLAPDNFKSVDIAKSALTKKRIRHLQDLDDIVMSFIDKNKIQRQIWQFPTILLPLFFNGKKRETVILRPICSDEAMTANFYKMDSDLLKKLTAKLKSHVSAVLYDITNKPPGTIEWE